jgi:DNA-binding Lrp family transcriptional regulator
MNLQDKDLKLIAALEKDGRARFAPLSRLLGISISTVAKKTRQLLEEGVVEIKAVTNPHRLGLNAHAIMAIRTSPKALEKVSALLVKHPNTELVTSIFSRFNLLISAQFESWDGLHEFISSELSVIHEILDMEIYFTRENKKRYFDAPFARSENLPLKIDETDQQIINLLCVNGRYRVSDLADTLGLSISTASKRLSRLYDENAIQVRGHVNQTKIGNHATAFFLIKAKHEEIDSICRNIVTYPEISTVITLINQYDIFVGGVCRDSDALYDLVNNRITAIPGVTDIETWPRGKIFKRQYGLLPVKQ